MLYKSEIGPISGLTGGYALVRLQTAHAGYLARLVVEQPGGNADGFTVTVLETYPAAVAIAGGGVNWSPPGQVDARDAAPPAADAAPQRSRVGSPIVVAPASRVAYNIYSTNVGFVTERDPNKRERYNELYLLITPTTGGMTGKTFHAAVMTASEA